MTSKASFTWFTACERSELYAAPSSSGLGRLVFIQKIPGFESQWGHRVELGFAESKVSLAEVCEGQVRLGTRVVK